MPKEKCKTSPHCSHNTNGRDLDKPCSIEFPTHSLNKKVKPEGVGEWNMKSNGTNIPKKWVKELMDTQQ